MRTLVLPFALVASTLIASVGCDKRTPQQASPQPLAPQPEAAKLGQPLQSRSRQGSLVLSTQFDTSGTGTQKLKQDVAAELALIADEDDHAVLLIEVDGGHLLAKYTLSGRPGQILILPNGQVAVTQRDAASVCILSLEKSANRETGSAFEFREEATIATDAEPLALALSAESNGPRQLFIATGNGRTLEQVDLASRKTKVVFEIAQEPRAVVALDDGTVLVAHANAGVMTRIKGSEVIPMRLDQREMFSRQGFALTTLGRDAFAPDTFVLPDDVAASMAGHASGYGGGTVCEQEGWHPGWRVDSTVPGRADAKPVAAATNDGFVPLNAKAVIPNFRSFDCIDVMSTAGALRRISIKEDGHVRATVTQLGTACILPRAAASSDVRHEIYVACLGTNRIETIHVDDRAVRNEQEVPPTMTRRFTVPQGPVGLAVHDDTLLAWSQFAHQLSTVDLQTGHVTSIELPRAVELDKKVALGRILFHAASDPRISHDGRACASCHPDGASDGIGWATPEGRRKPLVLAGRIGDGPFGWRGEHKTLREHLTSTITRNLHGTGLDTPSMEALESYIHKLPEPPKRHTSDATIAKRGKQLFESAETGCVRCHNPETGYSDGMRHEVGTGGSFRTPPLRAVVAAAPYTHDAKYARLDDFLRQSNGNMGYTSQLSAADFQALVRYVQTL